MDEPIVEPPPSSKVDPGTDELWVSSLLLLPPVEMVDSMVLPPTLNTDPTVEPTLEPTLEPTFELVFEPSDEPTLLATFGFSGVASGS